MYANISIKDFKRLKNIAKKTKSKVKIENKFKFFRSTIILILIILGIYCISISKEKKEYIDYTVCEGDTLWDIAKKTNKRGCKRLYFWNKKYK